MNERAISGDLVRSPLAARLRAEAAEWDEHEAMPGLLIEAAEAIEALAAKVAICEWEAGRIRETDKR